MFHCNLYRKAVLNLKKDLVIHFNEGKNNYFTRNENEIINKLLPSEFLFFDTYLCVVSKHLILGANVAAEIHHLGLPKLKKSLTDCS